MRYVHQPVLVPEALRFLNVRSNGVYVDGTVGEGGHAYEILNASGPEGVLIGLDRDGKALSAARKRLEPFEHRFFLYNEPFDRLEEVLFKAAVERVHGILLDLGFSSFHMDDPARGFGFLHDAPLDMRYDRRQRSTARDLLNRTSSEELTRILREYGEERWAGRIAGAIVRERASRPVETTGQLARIVWDAVPPQGRKTKIHPATRTFQAIRIAVNQELDHLQWFLQKADQWLEPGGRLVVISYHSLEDRMVKQAMQDWNLECVCPKSIPRCVCRGKRLFRIVTRKPVVPSPEELNRNRRARSAKLRAAEKL